MAQDRPISFEGGPAALLAPAELDLLRVALDGYIVDAVHEVLGPSGRAALDRHDLDGAARAVASPTGTDTGDARLTTLIRLFVLGRPVPEPHAAAALHPLPLDAARAGGLLDRSAGSVRALVDIRPYAQHRPELPGESASGPAWWVVSDFGADVRPGELDADHVLGVGSASLTLAQAVPRSPVGAALDLGTGSGVQALHLSAHASRVTATDVSARALRLAATTAALSGCTWDLRAGSLLDPVADDRFDLVVANPPFVVSPGRAAFDGWTYRDGGPAGDAISEALVRGLPAVLTAGGSAHLLANWLVPAEATWQERVGGWLADGRCDAWVWQREVAEPGEYVALWLRDAGLTPGTPAWSTRYAAWLDWFATTGAVAVGMGLVSMWRTDADDPTVVLEDVPQALAQPVGPAVAAWIGRARWLAGTDDATLLAAALRAEGGLVRERADVIGSDGWQPVGAVLRQPGGMRWRLDVDDAVAGIVAAADGQRPLAASVAVLATALGRSTDEVARALLPVVRDLVGRGMLLPPGPAPDGAR